MRQLFFGRAAIFAIWSLLLSPVDSCGQTTKTGEFDLSFTERSPLSAKADLIKRMIDVPDAPDYDLAKEPFRVYVPQNYDPAIAHGIIVWMNYKPADSTPPRWKPLLDQKHLIFIVSRNNAQPEWIRGGLALDAVHNLKKLYTIDDKRIFLFGFPNPDQYIPQRMGLAAPDVFTGFMYLINVRYFRPLPVPGQNASYPARLPRPQGPLFAQSKTRRHIIAPEAGNPAFAELVAKAYQQDGFNQVLTVPVSLTDDVHYPDMTTPWLEKALAFLDAAPSGALTNRLATAPAAAAPTSRPATAEPQRLLSLARSYISAQSYPSARSRLEEIISKYPNDPAAKDAKTLLDQIKDR